MEHRVYIGEPDHNERVYWQCSCGTSGSCNEFIADLKSDEHIQDGETRVDTNKEP